MNQDQITREHFITSIQEELQLSPNADQLLNMLEWLDNYIHILECDAEVNITLAEKEINNNIKRYEE